MVDGDPDEYVLFTEIHPATGVNIILTVFAVAVIAPTSSAVAVSVIHPDGGITTDAGKSHLFPA